MLASSALLLIGFVRNATQPASRLFAASSTVCAVSATIGVAGRPRSRSHARIARVAA
jgi:hypothetical protein